MTPLEKLEPAPVLETVRRLEGRIAARFPERGLRRLAGELVALTGEVGASAETTRGRMRLVRIGCRVVAAVVLVAVVVLLVLTFRASVLDGPDHDAEWLSLLADGTNDVVFGAVAIWFLYTVPERLRRATVLKLLHRLRSLAHIIDMHQLTKDPERLRVDFNPTSVSPDMDLDAEQLEHYLDYCSELLSLVGKAAALCAEESQDPIVLDTVSTIEDLTTGMSRKIWQKIAVLNEVRPG